MATKKIVPANPDTEAAAKADGKTAERKTAAGNHRFRKTASFKVGHRKTGRKSSSLRSGH